MTSGKSFATFIGDGTTNLFAFNFPYLDKEHIKVYFGVDPVAFAWSGDYSIIPSSVAAEGTEVVIRRETPGDLLVDYKDGSILLEHDLDLSYRHALYMAQENAERTDTVIDAAVEAKNEAEAARASALAYSQEAQERANEAATSKTQAQEILESTQAAGTAGVAAVTGAVTAAQGTLAGYVSDAQGAAQAAANSASALGSITSNPFAQELLGQTSLTGALSNILVQPQGTPTGTPTRPVMSMLTARRDIRDFGVRSSAALAYDSTAYFQAAIDTIPAGGSGTFYVPEGAYLITSTLQCSGKSVAFFGSGPGTRIVMTGTAGFINFTYAHGQNYVNSDTANALTTGIEPSLYMSDLTFLCTGVATQTCVMVTNTTSATGAPFLSVMLENCIFKGFQPDNTGWKTHLLLQNTNNVWVNNCQFYGQFHQYNCQSVIMHGHCVEKRFHGCMWQYMETGIYDDNFNDANLTVSGGSEGTYISSCTFAFMAYGIKRVNQNNAESEPLLSVSNSHFNVTYGAIWAQNAHEIYVLGNLIYVSDGIINKADPNANVLQFYVGTVTQNGQAPHGVFVANNVIRYIGSATRGVNCTGLVSAIPETFVSNNLFRGFTYGVIASPGCSMYLNNNVYQNCANQIANNSAVYATSRVGLPSGTVSE